jgi:plasmid stabilization system protein ParE
VARVELSVAALEDLRELIVIHELPGDTPARVARSLRPLERFPDMGVALVGRWSGMRFLPGPWRRMLLVYLVLDDGARVVVVTIQDARAASSPTSER